MALFTLAQRKPAQTWLEQQIERGRSDRFTITGTLTPEMASEAIARNKRNRPRSMGRSLKYSRIMQEGRWRLSSQGISFDKDGNLDDGQHRLYAVTIADLPVPMTFTFGCDRDEFLIKDRGAARTPGDVIGAALSIKNANHVAATARLLNVLAGRGRADDPNAIYLFERTLDHDKLQEAIRAGHKAKDVGQVSMMAIAYYHIVKNTKYVSLLDPFWNDLALGTNLKNGTPLYTVRKALVAARKERSTQSTYIRNAGRVIIAWNAVATGKKPRHTEWVDTTSLPKVA